MKKYNFLMAGVVVWYVLVAVCTGWILHSRREQTTMEYKVEINDLMTMLSQGTALEKLPLQDCVYVKQVRFLSAEDAENQERQQAFFAGRNQYETMTKPLSVRDEWKGYLCFDYQIPRSENLIVWYEGILAVLCAAVLGILWYVRKRILEPFWRLSNMPYELAKGHLRGELPESREKYFGRFIWGISMLRDTLQSARKRELQLAREKKTLILSISHDIKIPLSAIKLQARRIYEGLVTDEEERRACGRSIEQHADEIEQFVRKIMEAFSDQILSIEVENSEFYLGDYVNRIKEIYTPKCSQSMVDLQIAKYENHLLKGDLERAVEVMENLLENALKYGDGRQIRISFYEEDYCQVIEVFNTGEVVSRQEIPHLFDSFFRGSNAKGKEGNGLGLYICRQIMLKMSGDIFVQTKQDGMSFCLVFAQ